MANKGAAVFAQRYANYRANKKVRKILQMKVAKIEAGLQSRVADNWGLSLNVFDKMFCENLLELKIRSSLGRSRMDEIGPIIDLRK